MEAVQEDYPDCAEKICKIMQERDKEILQLDVRIKFMLNTIIEPAEREVKELERESQRNAELIKELDEQLEQLDFINASLGDNRDVQIQSVINHNTLEKMLAAQLLIEQRETARVVEEWRVFSEDAKLKLVEDPRQKELENARAEYLKVHIKLKMREMKIRESKRITAQKKEIQQRMYYNFFIRLAEDYVTERKLKELEVLKRQEVEAIRNLYELQEKVKLKQKFGTSSIKNISNIIFGSQELQVEKPTGVIQTVKSQKSAELMFNNQKLNALFQEEEIMPPEVPEKIRILDQQVLIPPVMEPLEPLPKKRTGHFCTNWLKKIKFGQSQDEVPSCRQTTNLQLDQNGFRDPEVHEDTSKVTVVSFIQECADLFSHYLTLCIETLQFRFSVMCEKPPESVEGCVKIPKEGLGLSSTSPSQIINRISEDQANNFQQQILQNLQCFGEKSQTTQALSDFVQSLPPSSKMSHELPSHDKTPLKPRSILTPTENKNASKSVLYQNVKTVRFNLESNQSKENNVPVFGQSPFRSGAPFVFSFDHANGSTVSEEQGSNAGFLSNSDAEAGEGENYECNFTTCADDVFSPNLSHLTDTAVEPLFNASEKQNVDSSGPSRFFSLFGSKPQFPFNY
ncbi:uncharacterized protein [Euwallacea similis]|uniref:uncharacterized protein n=1 Tax=Euwallacea similis TaxID=1736056 RepID=UPI00344B34A2